jgi:hypothetical protein
MIRLIPADDGLPEPGRMTDRQRMMARPITFAYGPDPRQPNWVLQAVLDWLNKHRGRTHSRHIRELLSTLDRSLALWAQIFDQGKEDEHEMAIAVVELWTLGNLRQVRLCEQCKKKWFAMKHKNYRFCRDRCRPAFFRSTEEGKAKGRLRQKKYREGLKRREKNELKIR